MISNVRAGEVLATMCSVHTSGAVRLKKKGRISNAATHFHAAVEQLASFNEETWTTKHTDFKSSVENVMSDVEGHICTCKLPIGDTSDMSFDTFREVATGTLLSYSGGDDLIKSTCVLAETLHYYNNAFEQFCNEKDVHLISAGDTLVTHVEGLAPVVNIMNKMQELSLRETLQTRRGPHTCVLCISNILGGGRMTFENGWICGAHVVRGSCAQHVDQRAPFACPHQHARPWRLFANVMVHARHRIIRMLRAGHARHMARRHL